MAFAGMCNTADLSNAAQAPRDISQLERIHVRLAGLRDLAAANANRAIEIGARAFGGSQVNAQGKEPAKPQITGSIANIHSVIDELEAVLHLESEAIAACERIV